jgi:hypothetical protein
MNRVVLHSRVGADGVLHLTVPLGEAEAEREVEVTIEPALHTEGTRREDWQQFVRETAGAWQGELSRPPQGDYEQRDELP